MPRILTAHAHPCAYEVSCPHCGEGLEDPQTCSDMITPESLLRLEDHAASAGLESGEVQCWSCGEVYRLPAHVMRMVR